jgi:hypothetical protein
MDAINSNIFAWNVRGLNNLAHRFVLKATVEDAMALIVCVSESKLHHVTPYVVMESFSAHLDGFVYVHAIVRGDCVGLELSGDHYAHLQGRCVLRLHPDLA